MTVVEHLGELRSRLVWSGLAFLIISIVAFSFYDPILEIFRRPLCSVPRRLLEPNGCDLVYNRLIGAFQFRLKLTALVGIAASSPIWLYHLWAFIVPALTTKEKRYAWPFMATSILLFLVGIAASSPIWLYHLWAFIVPALTTKEKRYAWPFMATSILLFLVGAATAYFALPTGVRFLVAVGGENLIPLLGAEEYLNFVGLMLLGFGLMFELPLVLFFLGLAGAVSVEQLRRGRRIAIVVIVALAAIITPSGDPYTMLLLAVPLYVLYELTIVVLKVVLRRRAAR
jgi:sec-independent protein translocase protein TatC